MTTDSKVLKLYPIPTTPIVDVFQGEGWETWTRILYKRGRVIPLTGAKLTPEQLATVQQQLSAK